MRRVAARRHSAVSAVRTRAYILIICCVRCQLRPAGIFGFVCSHLQYLVSICAVCCTNYQAHSISPTFFACLQVGRPLALLRVLVVGVDQRHRRRLPTGVHDLGVDAVRALRAHPAAAAGVRHLEQRALQGRQRPGHERVVHHGGGHQVGSHRGQ